jgi:methanogenic corrinoid protein MtbC1
MSGRICEELVAAILPPAEAIREGQPKIAMAVLEDHHRLGSRIVLSVLRASGYAVLDYGDGLAAEDLARRAAADHLSILLISTLMLPSALRVREVRRGLADLGAGARIVVGGAPFVFDGQLWQDVGADAMGRSASDAVAIVAGLTGARR